MLPCHIFADAAAIAFASARHFFASIFAAPLSSMPPFFFAADNVRNMRYCFRAMIRHDAAAFFASVADSAAFRH